MSVEIDHVRKVVVIAYDTNVVKGTHASVQTTKPDGAYAIERKQVPNHGHANLYFPLDYEGECYVEVHGSREGVDANTITVK